MKSVGITGGAGRIGTALIEDLNSEYAFTIFDIKEAPHTASPRARYFRVDLSKAEDITGLFEGLDAIIHLAGDPSTQAPWESVLPNNVMATYNVYEEARRAGVSKIVFASTNHVQHGYTMAHSPATEDLSYVNKNGLIKATDPPAPDSLYGVSKLFGEDLGRYYSRFFGIQFVALRIGWAAPRVIPPNVTSAERSLLDHFRVMYISRRDLTDAFHKALELQTDFLVTYAVGNNTPSVFDLSRAKEELGFHPRDNSADIL